jgi:Domain of unknown function DUF29
MKTVDWQELATTSHYQMAIAIRNILREGNVENATIGLEELIDALSRSDRRALESHLTRLLTHVIKWKVQPERRSRSWRNTILNARTAIMRLQRHTPSLNRSVIEEDWDELTEIARREAEGETNRDIPPLSLTWKEVFEDDYTLENP